ncbi:MAG: hypothetical protein JNM17_01220 [Archangium sp.]|nr:hypothetical protein [Archangium sp.]
MKKLVLVSLLALSACPAQPTPDPIIVPAPPEDLVIDHWTPVVGRDAGMGNLGPLPVGRVSRRLTVHQLDQTIRSLAGTGWMLNGALPTAERNPDDTPQGFGAFSVDALLFLGAGMGRADYLTEFRETTDVTPTFAKLMDNWAAHQCVLMVLDDYTTPDSGTQFFAEVWPENTFQSDGGPSPARRAAVVENLRLARLHFQGIYTQPQNAEAELGALANTFDAIALRQRNELVLEADGGVVIAPDGGLTYRFNADQSDLSAFGAACTLLLTDPEFVTY